MSSLIPERTLIISPTLATTIGLEEAVLLQLLEDSAAFCVPLQRQNRHWYSLNTPQLQALLPFWSLQDLQRIACSLRDKGIILLDDDLLTRAEQLLFALSDQLPTPAEPATSTPATSPPLMPPTATRNGGACLLTQQWQPQEDLLQILSLNHAIPREFALAQLEDFIFYWHDRREISHSWPNKFRQHVLKQWRFHQSQQAQSARAIPIAQGQQWSPSPEALEILQRSQINNEFIQDAVPEFILYWRERGEASSSWNSKFVAHIRRQWAIYTKTLELDYEPREIAINWQPSEDVYDILRLANIDLEFARQQVAEFVLFWRDTREIKRSWNTKFLQHAKYKWATRHHMGQHYAGQQIADGSGRQDAKSTFEHLTDRSWAEGLVGDG